MLKDLKIREGKVDVVVEVVDKSEVREFEKFGKAGRVWNAKVKDDSGEMTLTLWNEDIDKINVGDKIHIKNGYVGEWQGESQLSAGRFGEIEVIGNNGAIADKAEESTTNESMESDQEESVSTKEEKVEEEALDEIEEEKVE